MDPRKAATVTAPDLLKAFRSDTQGVGGSDEPAGRTRLWVVYFDEQNGAHAAEDYPMRDLEQAMVVITAHLAGGEGCAVAAIVSATMPDLFRDALRDISQLES